MHNLNNTVQAQRSAVTGKLRDSPYSYGTSLSRLSETPLRFGYQSPHCASLVRCY